jgi:signal transduction histidine kinase
LIYQGHLHGVLLLGKRHHGDIYSDADLRIVAAVAHQGALAWENVRLVESLRALNRQLVRADEAQRKQVARDLHDDALQQLFFAKQGLLHDREEHAPLIELLDSTVRTLRRTIRGMRPPLLDQGLPLALEGLVDEMRKVAGPTPAIAWRSNTGDSLPLPDEQATALYRIAQEALANALKHAGAQQITVSLMVKRDRLQLCVTDDGIGAAIEREGHYGLTGMRERAAMIGARLHVDSAPDQGSCITVEIEVNPACKPRADLA